MKCDSCGDEIGNLGEDWVALGKTGDICTVCAAEEIEQLRQRVRELEGALIHMVNMAEQSGLTIFNNEFEAVRWARHVLKTEAGGVG